MIRPALLRMLATLAIALPIAFVWRLTLLGAFLLTMTVGVLVTAAATLPGARRD